MKPEPTPQPPAPGVVRFYSFLPQGERLRDDVLAGLALPKKSIPPKYFYDEQGCRLF
jgi:L-histidine Nalpha-methyltransferase